MFENKKVFTINISLMLAILVLDFMYMLFPSLMLKTVTSLVFVAAGVVNLLFAIAQKVDLKFPIILCVALFVAMLGDVIINIEFMSGAIIFAVGHIFYFVAYCMLKKFSWVDLVCIIGVAIPSLCVVLFTPGLNYGAVIMKVVCCAYAAIISCMVGKALGNMIKEKTLTNIIIFIGSALFFISDLMLLLNVFGNIKWAIVLCLLTYYVGQIIIAFGAYVWVFKSNKKSETIANK